MAVDAVIAVSSKAFLLGWWILVIFHIVCIMYAVGVISIHRYIIAQNLQVIVDYLGYNAFGYFQPVIVTKYLVIVCHSVDLLRTVFFSLDARQCRFSRKQIAIRAIHLHPAVSPSFTDAIPVKTRFPRLRHAWRIITSHLELYTISGARYDSFFFNLELVENAFQTFQAYKLSRLVAAVWINRLYAVVLVCNWWSTVFVRHASP